jgi:hypothetical protein
MAIALDQVDPEKAVQVLTEPTLDQKELGWILSDSMAGMLVHKDTGEPMKLSPETTKAVLKVYMIRKFEEMEDLGDGT